ncbi:predicted protein [Ostreococcus lucimarinus CCE9901]|uniref:Uncharacterized protein n=1 Tax=Ostreococcus lucimarinus (strain CCE9901) TaxID=436017 RepID=A4SAN3_OSTLU|nr:predicted protein [Ostreococcus lucimarinus CCE9901]ABP00780.1 predicted protein [Ostreococcus lucimarinus CCE9901]|eukprot:XP_001422463.1 predicted protein [Ostreococcus lucimarinus CCE9901]
MTGEWDARTRAGGKKTTTARERRRATTRGNAARREGGKGNANGDTGLGPNPYETLRKKSSAVLFENEVASSAREVATARRRAAEELRASGSKRDATKEEREALMRAEESLVKAERAAREVERAAKAEAARAAKEAAAAEKAAAAASRSSAAPSSSSSSSKRSAVRASSDGRATDNAMGVVVEVGKFVLPAVVAWFARQPTVRKLRTDLNAMTTAKIRAALEATKLRAQLVELREKLALAEAESADVQAASEKLMTRRNSVKEVKCKQMAVDHVNLVKKVRAEAAKDVSDAKALEIGARWREEACRRMKNRAVAEAETLRAQIAALEKKVDDLEHKRHAENVEAVKNTVVGGFDKIKSLAKHASMKIGKKKNVTEAIEHLAPLAVEASSGDARANRRKAKGKSKSKSKSK